MRVKGQVTWKFFKGSGDDADGSDDGDDEDGSDDGEDAELKLKRLVKKNGKTRVSGELTLAEGPPSDEFTSLTFDLKPDNDPFWQTDGEGKVMSGLNYKLDPQVSLQPRNCYHTHIHTRTHTLVHTHTHTHTHLHTRTHTHTLTHPS